MISKYEQSNYCCMPFENSDYISCDKVLSKTDQLSKDICRSIIYMIQDNEIDAFKRVRPGNLTTSEKIVFHSLTKRNIEDYLDSSVMYGSFRCIYLSDISDFDYKLIKFPSYNKTKDNTNHICTLLIGVNAKDDDEVLIGILIEVITYFLHLELKKIGVTMNRSSNIYTNDIIYLPDHPTISDIQFAVNYYSYIFKNLGSIFSATMNDYNSIYNAMCKTYDDLYIADNLKDVYRYALDSNHDIDDYRDLLSSVYSSFNE